MTNKLPGWACSVLCAAGVVLVASMFVNWIDVAGESASGFSLALHENKWLFLVPIAGVVLAITAGARMEGARIAAIAAGTVITGYTLFYLAKGLAFEGGAQTWLMFGGAGALLAGATKNGRMWRVLGGAAVLAGFFAPWARMSMWDFMTSGLFDLAAKEAPYIRLLWLIPLAGVVGLASALSSGPKGGKVSLLAGIGVFGSFAGVLGMLANEVLGWGAWAAFGASTVALVIGVLAPKVVATAISVCEAREGLILRAIFLVAALGCGTEPKEKPEPRKPEPIDAAEYLKHSVTEMDFQQRKWEIERWEMDRATWDRIVVAPFGSLYDDYRSALADLQPKLVRLNASSTYASRRHFAGDPDLTLGQVRARWLLTVLFPSEVVTVDGKPLDLVFLRERDRWYALTGIDRAIRKRIDARDPSCGALIDADTSKTCRDAAWAVAEATLRTDDTRFVHACAIAKTACAKPSP